MCFKAVYNMFIFKKFEIFRTAILEPLWSHSAKISHKLAKSKKFEINRNLQRLPFKMMYKMFMLRHRFSNERWGGGGSP